jgi:transcriptional regulator with XRE-family HTH domain
MGKIETERKFFRSGRMRELREEMGWTQDECGERSGLGQRRWGDIEAGKYDNLSLATFTAIARALDVESYDELLAPIQQTGPATAPRKPAAGKAKGAKGVRKAKDVAATV